MSFLFAIALLLQESPKVDQGRIDNAVERGAKYLTINCAKSRDVNHPFQGKFEMDELVLYTLLHAGVSPTDSIVMSLADRLSTKELKRTYNVALCAMALDAYDRAQYQWRVAQCAQFLVDNQAVNGQWGYGDKVTFPSSVPTGPPKAGGGQGTKALPTVKIKRNGKGPAWGDNSNSQYAALGIRACMKAGVIVPDATLVDAAKWWEKAQKGDGGWGYCDEGTTGDAAYGAMTAGGTASMLILRDLQKQDLKKDPAIKKGLEWMAANLDYTRNPGYHSAWMWQFYWIYAVERAADLASIDKVGGHWWYSEGCEYLFGAQQKDGSWIGLSPDNKESVGGAIADTCFAILFMRRATKAAPRVATGTGK